MYIEMIRNGAEINNEKCIISILKSLFNQYESMFTAVSVYEYDVNLHLPR